MEGVSLYDGRGVCHDGVPYDVFERIRVWKAGQQTDFRNKTGEYEMKKTMMMKWGLLALLTCCFSACDWDSDFFTDNENYNVNSQNPTNTVTTTETNTNTTDSNNDNRSGEPAVSGIAQTEAESLAAGVNPDTGEAIPTSLGEFQ